MSQQYTGYGQKNLKVNQHKGVWLLDWYDDFSSSTIDTTKWVLQEGGDDVFGAGEHWYTLRKDDEDGANAYIEDGKLVLETREEADYGGHGETYTSAMIRTYQLKAFDYGGKIEVRAKLPGTQGMFPAIWMSSNDELYSTRRLNGEIDIMEFLGHDTDKVYGGAWFYDVPDLSSYSSPDDFEIEYYDNHSNGNLVYVYDGNSVDFTNSYHVFSLEWESTGFKYKVDGKTFLETTFSDYEFGSLYEPFQTTDNSFYLRLNIAVGGAWAGAPDETSIFPQKFYIDYVKYYRRVD